MADPIVCLPGMMCDARLFAPQIAAFSRDRVVVVAPVAGGETMQDIVAGLLADLPNRFALAGLSMGGILAMELLRQAPERVSRLCLMDTNPLAETPNVAEAREPLIERVRAGDLETVMRDTVDHAGFLTEGPHRAALRESVLDMAHDLGPDVYVRQSRALQTRPDQQEVLRACRVPALILCGAEDRVTPPRRHTLMAELIPGARLKVIEDAAHISTLEQPQIVTDAMRDWLD